MFQSKLNMYTIQKSAEEKLFLLFIVKVWNSSNLGKYTN